MLVVDAGPLIAAAAARDRHHERCVELLSNASPIVVPSLVVSEVAYFVGDRLGDVAGRAFAKSIRDGELLVEPVEPSDWNRIVELLTDYEDLGIGVVDASVVAACERLGVTKLATLDRRHFSVVQPRHCERLSLLPD